MLGQADGQFPKNQAATGTDYLRTVVDRAPMGIATIDKRGKFVFTNAVLQEMLGFSAREFQDLDLLTITHPDDQPACTSAVHDYLRRGESRFVIEKRYLARDGRAVWVRASASVIPDAPSDGGPAYIVFYEDITKQRLAQQALEEMETRFRAVIEQVLEAVLLVDPVSEIVVDVNHAFCDLFRHDRQDILQVRLGDLRGCELLAESIGTVVENGVLRPAESTFLGPVGEVVHVQFTATKIVGAGRDLICFVARDMTEIDRLHAQLQLADRMASIGSLAAGVAHEFNNPLAAIMANVDYIAEELAGIRGLRTDDMDVLEELRPIVTTVQHGLERVRDIVADLGRFSNSAQEGVGQVDVREVLELSIHLTRTALGHRARLIQEFEPVPTVLADEGRLGQVFVNLLLNAIQALDPQRPDDDAITVRTRRTRSGWVMVQIEDTGSGINLEDQQRAFDPFFTTRPVGQGTGLGLAISHSIITSLGGRISLQSQPGKGTIVEVLLPPAKD